MANKPRHKEPTNFEHCCSCCNVMAREIKQLKAYIKTINKRSKTNELNPV